MSLSYSMHITAQEHLYEKKPNGLTHLRAFIFSVNAGVFESRVRWRLEK